MMLETHTTAEGDFQDLIEEAQACGVCQSFWPVEGTPILEVQQEARILIVARSADGGNGSAVLAKWLGLAEERLRVDPLIGKLKMGLCEVSDASVGVPTLCAPLWHPRFLALLSRLECLILVGVEAQRYYLRELEEAIEEQILRSWPSYAPRYFPLPDPSNASIYDGEQWFGELKTALQEQVQLVLS